MKTISGATVVLAAALVFAAAAFSEPVSHDHFAGGLLLMLLGGIVWLCHPVRER